LSVIDDYLEKGYRDTDIPSGVDDHIKNSKDYINSLFARYPSIRVKVGDSMERDNALSVFLEWYVVADGANRILRKGIASFTFSKDNRITNRTTHIYFDRMN